VTGERTGPILAIAGPTATGKTALAIDVACAIDGEIISADSRQAYGGLSVGTAAPSRRELDTVPHHGVGFLDLDERYGAGRFGRLARGWVDGIRDAGRIPIICGGTGLFFRSLTDPVFAEPALDAGRRARLGRWLDSREGAELERWMRKLDPVAAARLPVVDPQRAARALEVALLTGHRLSELQAGGDSSGSPIALTMFVLELDRDEHRRRIRARTESQLDDWIEEVRGLIDLGVARESKALTSIGYGTVMALIEGQVSREDAAEAIIRDTWQYARRQRTWFRHQVGPDVVRLDAGLGTAALASQVIREMENRNLR